MPTRIVREVVRNVAVKPARELVKNDRVVWGMAAGPTTLIVEHVRVVPEDSPSVDEVSILARDTNGVQHFIDARYNDEVTLADPA